MYSSEAYLSLEGCRQLNTFKGRSDKRPLKAPLDHDSFSDLSEPAHGLRSPPFRVISGLKRVTLPEDNAAIRRHAIQ